MDQTKRRSRRAVIAVAVTTVAVLAVGGIAYAASFTSGAPVVVSAGNLRDLQPNEVDNTDGAVASVSVVKHNGSTTITLDVSGLDPATAGKKMGSHVHVGPCLAGNPDAAGPHFNSTGGKVISNQTEVWIDFTVLPGGRAHQTITVPFTIPAGAASAFVLHGQPTDPATGMAGPRLACLPIAL